MSADRQPPGRVLYVITCATPAARDVGKLVTLAQERGWRVCVIATPSALAFLDKAAIEEQTGFVVRHQYKIPGTPDVLPPPDAMIAGGASFNTLSKWALGIADTLALGLLTEGIGLGIPIAALPFVNTAQTAHPAFTQHIETLRAAGSPSCSAPAATNRIHPTKAPSTCTSTPGKQPSTLSKQPRTGVLTTNADREQPRLTVRDALCVGVGWCLWTGGSAA